MIKIGIYEAKANLSKYIRLLESGIEQEIILSKHDKEIAKIVLINNEEKGVRVGAGEMLFGKKEFTLKDERDNLEKLFGY